MLLLLLAATLLLSGVHSSPDENLAIGRPSFVSSSATPPSNCTTGSHLEVDAGVAAISDDCGCVITNGSTPPNLRDWYAVQLAAPSLVRAVRISGITTSFDVLVGQQFSANMSLDAFSLCATYNTTNNAQIVSCTRAISGSVVALRALNDTSQLRLCEVEVFELAGLMNTSWQSLLSGDTPQEQPWRLVDGDVSTCVDADPAYRTAPKIRILDGTPTPIRVLVYHQNVPLNAFTGDACREAYFGVTVVTDTLSNGYNGLRCDFVQASVASSLAEFQCACPRACQGDVAIRMSSKSPQLQWRVCEVIVNGPEVTSLPLFNECAAPSGSVGVGTLFDDSAFSASSSVVSYSSPQFARYNFVPSFPSSMGAWCPSAAAVSWVAIDLVTLFKLRAVLVQGGSSNGFAPYVNSYVTSFSVGYALGQSSWEDYLAANGSVAVFSGPSHPSTPVLRSFSPDLVASRVRLTPLTWVLYPCLRFELIGCPLVKREWSLLPVPAISGPLGIANSAIKASTEYNYEAHRHAAKQVRIGSLVSTGYFIGAWAAGVLDTNQYVEIDFGAARTVVGIALRGRADLGQWVTSFNLLYKMDDAAAFTTFSASPLTTFISDQTTIMYQSVYPQFDAKVVRVNPMGWYDHISLRMDIFTASTQPTLISRKVVSDCDPGYKAVSSYGCYRYVGQSMAYADAEQFCANDGAHLARVMDYDEWNAVSQWLPKPNLTALFRQKKAQGLASKYQGCYVDGGTRDLPTYQSIGEQTRDRCEQWCLDQGQFKYSGTQASTWCFCGDRLGLYGRAAETDCNTACGGNSTVKCGGSWRNSVTARGNWTGKPHLKWTYKGCFLDDDDRDLQGPSTTSATMHVDACVAFCSTQGFYQYVGLQNGTMCFCSNSVGKYGQVNSSECSLACGGDPTEVCGSSYRNSVFEVSYEGESCVWLGGKNSSANSDTFQLTGIGDVVDVWKSTMPIKSIHRDVASALCLDQATGYDVASIPLDEKRHFVCEKDQPRTSLTPVGLWPFTAAYQLKDISAYRQHATAGSGASVTRGFPDSDRGIRLMNNALLFDNTVNAFVDIPLSTSVDLSGEFTVMFNIYYYASGLLFCFRDPLNALKYVGMWSSGATVYVELPRQSDRRMTKGSFVITGSVYNLIALTYNMNDGVGRVYMNGNLVLTLQVGEGERLLVSSQIRMGYLNILYNNDALNGVLYCMQLYDRALRLHEIAAVNRRCNAYLTRGMLGFWPLHGDLSNFIHRLHSATSSSVQYVAGPPYNQFIAVTAAKTNGSNSSALTIAGPLNVDGDYTVVMHTKTWNGSGTVLSLQTSINTTLQVNVSSLNVSSLDVLLLLSGVTLGRGSCWKYDQWTQLVVKLDTTALRAQVYCNTSLTVDATLNSDQVTTARVFSRMEVASSVAAAVSCLILHERIMTPIEMASLFLTCPFRLDGTYNQRSTPRRHCGEWLTSGSTTSGLYLIDPDGSNGPADPFTVYCDMTDSYDQRRGATVVRHMIDARTRVTGANGTLTVPFVVAYEAIMTQMMALFAVSAHCRQWLQYECSGSRIYSGATQYSGWYSRLNTIQPAWAGVPTGVTGCACSLRDQCAGGPTAKCNCDMHDAVWRQDSGWITDMDLLPVTKVTLGDAGALGGYLTLGNLTCYG